MKLVTIAAMATLFFASQASALSLKHQPNGTPPVCFKDFTVYKDKETVPDSDPCTTCRCDRGFIVRASAFCVPVLCSDGSAPIYLPGECCATTCLPPTCLDRNTGIRHPMGPIDDMDNCNLCTCAPTGDILCSHVSCAPALCPVGVLPVLKPGDCCYSCPEVTCFDLATGLSHPVGPVDMNDPCLDCTCDQNGFLLCMRETCPLGPCPRAVTKPGECCATCTFECDDEVGNFYDVGPVDDGDPCSTCKCDIFGNIQCTREVCAFLLCPGAVDPMTTPGDCCAHCPEPFCVDDDGNQHPVGEVASGDPCMSCECDASGEVLCSMKGCVPLPCPDPVRSEDRCCPICPAGCAHGGQWYSTGLIPSNDPCTAYFCDGETGQVVCSDAICPSL